MAPRDTFVHFKNYFTATLVTKALTLISVPVLTRILGVTPSDYGFISLFSTYVGIFICLVTLNSYVGVGRYYYEQTNDFKSYFGTTVNLNILLLLVVYGIAVFFVQRIAAFLDINPLLTFLLFPAVIWGIANSLFGQMMSAQQKSAKLAVFSIIMAYGGFVLTVVFTCLNPNNKYLGSIYSQVIIGFLSFFYIIKQLSPYYAYAFSLKHLRYMLTYSLPLIPYFLSSIILGQFDRVMIVKYQNIEDAGLYSFAYNIGMLLSLFFSSLNSAWIPKYYSVMNSGNYSEYDREVNYMHRFTLLAALGLICFGEEIGKILGSSNFHSSLTLIPVVVLGYLFYSYFYFWQWNIDYAKKTFFSSLIVGTGGFLNIVLNVIFLPRYGYAAAAYTTMISYFCMALLAWGINKFHLKIYAVKVRQLYKYFFLFLFFVGLFYFINTLSSIGIKIVLKIFIVSVFGGVCFRTYCYYLFEKWIAFLFTRK